MTLAATSAGRAVARRPHLVLPVLAALAIAALVHAIGAGALAIAPGHVVAALIGDPFAIVSSTEATVITTVRLPRVLLVALSGAALGLAGVALQGLFRNPLADPQLIGISPGAALAAAVVIVFGDRLIGAANLPFVLLPAGAFLGALAATALVYGIATRAGSTSITLLLLAGIAVGALTAAGTGLLIFLADDRQLRDITFWTLGSFSGVTWSRAEIVAPPLLLTLAAMPWLARPLDALALGEAEAWHMGVPVERTKRLLVGLAALAVGAVVAVAGVVGFVGVVVPHMARLAVGPRHTTLLPAAALVGAALLLVADTLARTIAAPAELPLGVITAAIGAPVFLHLLLRQARRLGA